MNKQHYAIKLLPSRPDFAQTMTETELSIMLEHIEYWKKYMAEGIMLVFGPVMDPAGVYGLGIVEVDSEDQLKELLTNDPASRINRYEYYPMRAVTPAKP